MNPVHNITGFWQLCEAYDRLLAQEKNLHFGEFIGNWDNTSIHKRQPHTKLPDLGPDLVEMTKFDPTERYSGVSAVMDKHSSNPVLVGTLELKKELRHKLLTEVPSNQKLPPVADYPDHAASQNAKLKLTNDSTDDVLPLKLKGYKTSNRLHPLYQKLSERRTSDRTQSQQATNSEDTLVFLEKVLGG
eukprot:UN29210